MSCIAPSRDFFRGAPPPEKHFFIRAPETDPAVLIAGPIAVHRSPSDRRVATDDGPERSRCSFRSRRSRSPSPPRTSARRWRTRRRPRATWRTSRSSPGTSSTRSSRSSATRTGALCFTPRRRRVRVRVRLPARPGLSSTPPAPPGRAPHAPPPPPLPPAGKTELVELFLGTPAGRALVNVGDEVRDAAPRVGRLDERVGVPTSFFLAAAADPKSRESPAPSPPGSSHPSHSSRSDPARVRRPIGLRFTPRAAPATSSACASSSPRARTPTARTRAGRGARTTPPAKAAWTRSSR